MGVWVWGLTSWCVWVRVGVCECMWVGLGVVWLTCVGVFVWVCDMGGCVGVGRVGWWVGGGPGMPYRRLGPRAGSQVRYSLAG